MGAMIAVISSIVSGFSLHSGPVPLSLGRTVSPLMDTETAPIETREKFFAEFEIPKKGISEYGTAQVKLAPLLEESELIQISYELPFGLAAEPQDGRAVVTKAGPGGEQPGDLLRCVRLVVRIREIFHAHE